MKTQYKLAVGYLLILIVVLLSRFASFSDLNKLEQSVTQIQYNHMPSVESLGRMGISASSIQRYLYDMTTEQDDDRVEDARRQSLDLMTEVHSRHMIYNIRYLEGPVETELFKEATEAWNMFLPVAKSIASDPASASHWYHSSQLKQLMQYWQQIDEKNMALIEYNAAESGKATRQSVALVESVKDNSTIGAITILSLVLFVWAFTSRTITRSEAALKESLDEMRRQADKIYRHAYYDNLTGLPNLGYFNEHIARRNLGFRSETGAIFYIDLDNFKLINDSYGHDWGNLFLKAFAERIQRIMPENGLFCRLGGDEFTIALFDFGQDEALEFAKIAIDAMGEPFQINNTSFYTTASIGIVLYPGHGIDAAELLRKADVAMYRAKEAGKNNFCLFDDFMEALVFERVALESSLRQAIAQGELSLHYQPIISLPIRETVGFEALLRWNSRKHGTVAPAKFIPIAENTGLIIPIGEWVLRQACTFIKEIHAAGFPDMKISVNLSAKQLAIANTADIVKGILEAAGLDARYLELEITETVLIESSGVSLRNLEMLAGMGLTIALDDFGTGYSSLTYLCKMPIHSLKLDKSFLDGVGSGDSKSSQAIVDGVISIAHEMGLSIVAEGIETEDQLAYLCNEKQTYAQGYLIGRPMPKADAINWLSKDMENWLPQSL